MNERSRDPSAASAAPLVYLAHASEDHETLAKPLAQRLMANGIDVWFDEWEIRTGDSLKRKMEEGLERCTHFVVLLTPQSIGKAWVESEIDAGFIRAVGGEARFLGLRIGTSVSDLSVFLRTLRCPSVDLAEEKEVHQIVADILDVSRKPPLGDKPRYVQNVPKDTGGWSPGAYAIAEHLVRTSKTGRKFDPQVKMSDAAAATGLPEEDVRLAVLDLTDAGLVERTKEIGGQTFFPLPSLFVEFDTRFLDFDSERDAVALANWLVSNGHRQIKVADLASAFPDFSVRRLNSALNYLDGANAVEPRRYFGPGEWTYPSLQVNDRTRRFVRNRA